MDEILDFSCSVCLYFNTFKFKLNSNVLVLAMQWIMSNLVSLHNRPMSALNLPKLQAYCWNFLNSNRILAFKKFSNCSFIFKNAYHVECPRMHGRRIWCRYTPLKPPFPSTGEAYYYLYMFTTHKKSVIGYSTHHWNEKCNVNPVLSMPNGCCLRSPVVLVPQRVFLSFPLFSLHCKYCFISFIW